MAVQQAFVILSLFVAMASTTETCTMVEVTPATYDQVESQYPDAEPVCNEELLIGNFTYDPYEVCKANCLNDIECVMVVIFTQRCTMWRKHFSKCHYSPDTIAAKECTNFSTWTKMGDKHYIVLDMDVTSHAAATAECMKVGGILPEPRNDEENDNLASLGTKRFYLGLRDEVVEGQWKWDSDGETTEYLNWVVWDNVNNVVPNGGKRENCAGMMKSFQTSIPGHSPETWMDIPCDWGNNDLATVCQRASEPEPEPETPGRNVTDCPASHNYDCGVVNTTYDKIFYYPTDNPTYVCLVDETVVAPSSCSCQNCINFTMPDAADDCWQEGTCALTYVSTSYTAKCLPMTPGSISTKDVTREIGENCWCNA